MSTKPPPVPFDAAADLDRQVGSCEAMLARIKGNGGPDTLRVLSRMFWIERALRDLAHGDVLKRADMNDSPLSLHPTYREMRNVREGGMIRLVVHDLCVVWNGTEWEGDGACSFNKMKTGKDDQDAHWYTADFPKCLYVMHASWCPYGQIGERIAESRQFVPSCQWLSLKGMKVGDYLMGELYLEIC